MQLCRCVFRVCTDSQSYFHRGTTPKIFSEFSFFAAYYQKLEFWWPQKCRGLHFHPRKCPLIFLIFWITWFLVPQLRPCQLPRCSGQVSSFQWLSLALNFSTVSSCDASGFILSTHLHTCNAAFTYRWLGCSVVVRVSDLWSIGHEFDSRPCTVELVLGSVTICGQVNHLSM